jgi:hypothetical protein
MLVAVPFIELGAQLGWSLSPGTLNWRTGAVGLLSSTTLTPTFGLVVAIVTACAFEHRVAQRALIGIAALALVACIMLLGTFALDSIQLRATVADEMRGAYTGAMIKAMLTLALTIVVLAVVFVGAFRARSKRGASGEGLRPKDMIVTATAQTETLTSSLAEPAARSPQ